MNIFSLVFLPLSFLYYNGRIVQEFEDGQFINSLFISP